MKSNVKNKKLIKYIHHTSNNVNISKINYNLRKNDNILL